MREALTLAGVQLLCYGLITVNNRATVLLDYPTAILTDIIYSAAQFFIIRKVATSPNSTRLWIAYVAGSVAGTVAGMLASSRITQ